MNAAAGWPLLAGETLLWSGRPGQGLRLTGRDVVLVPFSLVWLGGVVFWETMVLRQPHAPVFARLWGVPFLLAGLYIAFGRFVFDAMLRRATHYALTDRRVLIGRGWPRRSLTTLDLSRIAGLRLELGRNGIGSILFGPDSPASGRAGFGGWTPSLDTRPQFLAIENAQAVFDQITARASGA